MKNVIKLNLKVLLSVVISVLGANIASAQGTITDGVVSFTLNSSSFDSSPSADFKVPSPATVDHLFEQGWWFRVAGDAQETFFPAPTSQSYVGKVATLDWANVGGKNFSAQMVATIKEGSATSGRVSIVMTITNNNPTDLSIDLFHMTDFDVQPGTTNDSAALLNPNDHISITTAAPDTNTAEYRGVGANAFLVRGFNATTDVAGVLSNATVDNFDNTGAPFGPGDFTGGFQFSRVIAAGSSTTVKIILGINEPANSLTEACVLGDFSCSVVNQPTCTTSSGNYFADSTCADSDADGRADVAEICINNPSKFTPGICGCDVSDADTDSDGTADCLDSCKFDSNKTIAGACGCGIADVDLNANSVLDCQINADFKAELKAALKLIKRYNLKSKSIKAQRASLTKLRNSIANLGIKGASTVSASSTKIKISSLSRSVHRALTSILKAKSSKSLALARKNANAQIAKLRKGIL